MICCSARRPKRQLFVRKDHVTGANFLSATEGEPFNPSPNAVLILTLRMGFGHLRIAHAVASWLDGREAYVYDLLATDTPESESLKRYEWIYSKFSKVASASGGPIEWAFDKFLTSGDASAQCVCASPATDCPPSSLPASVPSSLTSPALGRNKLRDVALRLKPLTDGIPLDITVVATHAVAGHIAVEAGFRKVINLVVDNYAQHFNAVPGAINAVQAGALGAAYAKLGYQTVLAGHWADRRSAEGIHSDTARRMKRIHSKAPRRVVIAIGGAGAQATFVIERQHSQNALLGSARARPLRLLEAHLAVLVAYYSPGRVPMGPQSLPRCSSRPPPRSPIPLPLDRPGAAGSAAARDGGQDLARRPQLRRCEGNAGAFAAARRRQKSCRATTPQRLQPATCNLHPAACHCAVRPYLRNAAAQHERSTEHARTSNAAHPPPAAHTPHTRRAHAAACSLAADADSGGSDAAQGRRGTGGRRMGQHLADLGQAVWSDALDSARDRLLRLLWAA